MREPLPRTAVACSNRGRRPPRRGACEHAPYRGAGTVRSPMPGLSGTGQIFWWRSGPAHAGTSPPDRSRLQQQRAAPAPARCVRARTLPRGRHGSFSDAGLSGTGRSSSGRAAPLTWERRPGTASTRTDRGQHLPRMARSASPPEGQALPGRFGRPGGVGGNGARRQGRWPLPNKALLSFFPTPRSCGNVSGDHFGQYRQRAVPATGGACEHAPYR